MRIQLRQRIYDLRKIGSLGIYEVIDSNIPLPSYSLFARHRKLPKPGKSALKVTCLSICLVAYLIVVSYAYLVQNIFDAGKDIFNCNDVQDTWDIYFRTLRKSASSTSESSG